MGPELSQSDAQTRVRFYIRESIQKSLRRCAPGLNAENFNVAGVVVAFKHAAKGKAVFEGDSSANRACAEDGDIKHQSHQRN
jgi:hypothetical protein